MKTLVLAKDLKLPADEAVAQKYAFIGRSGSGKTYGAMKLAELFLEAEAQVIVLDWVGNWWALRLEKDGKSPGFPHVYIFGGDRSRVGAIDRAGDAGAGDAQLVWARAKAAVSAHRPVPDRAVERRPWHALPLHQHPVWGILGTARPAARVAVGRVPAAWGSGGLGVPVPVLGKSDTMPTVTVSLVNLQSGETRVPHCELVQFEDNNSRVYLQPVEGEPQRIPLVQGDSVLVVVE